MGLPRPWGWPASCAVWRFWATRWSTCARPPTRKWSSRSLRCGPCDPISTREPRRFPNGSACWSAPCPGRPRSPGLALPPNRARPRGPTRPARRRRLPRRPSPRPPEAPTPEAPTPEPPAVPRPPGEVARRPSIGAVRRSKEAADATPSAGATVPEAASAAPEPAPGTKVPAPNAPDVGGAKAGPAEPDHRLDRDSLTEAWGDGILRSLPARAKARYASGRFVSVDDQGVHFALPNSAHRDQCAEQQAVVEAALTAHFGTRITLVLDIDEAAAPPPPSSGSPPPRPVDHRVQPLGTRPGPRTYAEDDAEDVDPRELMEGASTDQASDAEARLFQAFPGASEVAG